MTKYSSVHDNLRDQSSPQMLLLKKKRLKTPSETSSIYQLPPNASVGEINQLSYQNIHQQDQLEFPTPFHPAIGPGGSPIIPVAGRFLLGNILIAG